MVGYWQSTSKPMKTMPESACYLSLNYVNDPIYNFEKQFPRMADAPCSSPIQCPQSTSGRRHLLQGRMSTQMAAGVGLAPSDTRLKTSVVPTGRRIASLPEYTWQWNDVAKALNLDGYPTVGVIAQEAQALFPEAVSTGADGFMRVNYGLLSLLSV